MSTRAPKTTTERQVASLPPFQKREPEGEKKPPTTTERQVEKLLGRS